MLNWWKTLPVHQQLVPIFKSPLDPAGGIKSPYRIYGDPTSNALINVPAPQPSLSPDHKQFFQQRLHIWRGRRQFIACHPTTQTWGSTAMYLLSPRKVRDGDKS